MKKRTKRIINSALCLTTVSAMLLGNGNNFVLSHAEDVYVEVKGLSHNGTFSVDSLTLQPGETTSSINLNWYAPEGTTQSKIQFGNEVYDVSVNQLTPPTEVKEDKYKDTGKLVCKTSINGLQPNTKYTYYISNDGGNTWSKEYTYTTPSSDNFSFKNDFESKTSEYIPDYFNCSNDDKTIDDRSGKKGPEAETVIIGQIEDKTYAFVGLERISGIVVYDITELDKATFVNYINSRDFSSDIAGDDSPEGLHFISGEDSLTGGFI